MVSPTKYWQMQILPIGEDVQLKHRREISRAKEFFKIQFPHLNSNCTLSTEENKQFQVYEVHARIPRCRDVALLRLYLYPMKTQTAVMCKNVKNNIPNFSKDSGI